jgi:hypothetical protein
VAWLLVFAAIALALALYWNRRLTRRTEEGKERPLMEASAEIGAPPEAVDREKALYSDRLAGVERPLVSPPDGEEGSLRGRPLRKNRLSKEVELDWEASMLTEVQPGAYARRRDFEDYALPAKYGKDRLVLMARDPRWIYAYWEVVRERHQETYEKSVSEWTLSRPVLRLYDLTETFPSRRQFDIQLSDEADNWYVRVDRPTHRFAAELGRMFNGRFVPFVRSNEVALPPESVSTEIAEEWAPLDWESQYGKYVGKGGSSSPLKWGQ